MSFVQFPFKLFCVGLCGVDSQSKSCMLPYGIQEVPVLDQSLRGVCTDLVKSPAFPAQHVFMIGCPDVTLWLTFSVCTCGSITYATGA